MSLRFLVDLLALIALLYRFMGFTWIYFLAVMNIKRHMDELRFIHKLWGYPAVYLFLVVDFFFNLVIGSLCYMELPPYWKGELLFTARCKRHLTGSLGWRNDVAHFWCKNFMNPFDPSGTHC